MAKKKKKGGAEERKGDSFIVLFTALSTILLALFIMMNAQATRSEMRVREVWSSIQANFTVLEGGVRFTPGKDILPPGPPILMASPDDWNNSALFVDMIGFFQEQPGGDGVVAYFDRNELVISIPSEVLFEPGSLRFRPGTEPMLRMVAHVVRRTLNSVEIGGYADDARAPETDWDLSASRALAVSDWIVRKGRVVPERLRTMAFGANAAGPGAKAYRPPSMTRRVSFRFLTKEDSALMPFSGSLKFKGFLFKIRSLIGGY